jgi:hypothetical protein
MRKVTKVPIASLNLLASKYQILFPTSEISHSVRQGSVKGPNRSRGSAQAGQMEMCDVSATLPSSPRLSVDFLAN